MKSDGKDTLNTYFGQQDVQYIIPFFQRAYVWTAENWSVFWENIEEELWQHEEGIKSEHFIGTIITKDASESWTRARPVELIDGQQRITTVALLLKAIADTSSGEVENLETYVNNMLVFKDKRGTEHHRIVHSRVDEKYFKAILNGQSTEEVDEGTSAIVDGYRYFREQIKPLTDERRDVLTDVILQKLPIISIELDDRDDEQEIFDTINSLGVRLTIGELLKNYIFRHPNLQPFYESTWLATFEDDEETVKFWDETKTSGRVKRTNLELLLYSYLIVETGKEVRLDKLYRDYKSYLSGMSTSEKGVFLTKLCDYATDYRNFPSVEELDKVTIDDREKRLFHVVEYLDISTVYPLLLLIYQKTEAGGERDALLALLESYLVRRQICGWSTKNYNRQFIGWIAELKQLENLGEVDLRSVIENNDRGATHMPTDEEVRKGFHQNYMYNRNAREILFLIALAQLKANSRQDVSKSLLGVRSYSVEHIMPKKWQEYWKESGMTEEDKATRTWKLKRLGNLTLITGTMNSSIRHKAWKTKRKELKNHSDLPITKDYLELDEWNEATMASRADDLAEIAVEIWPGLPRTDTENEVGEVAGAK